MPMDRSLYPEDWESIAFDVKQKSGWHCRQCQRPCRSPGETEGDFIDRIENLGEGWECDLWETVLDQEFGLIDKPKLGRFVLTVAHLNHIPSDCRPENLKALCSVCHLRYDRGQMRLKRRLKQERQGQLSLL